MADDVKSVVFELLVGLDESDVGLHAVGKQRLLNDRAVRLLQLLRAVEDATHVGRSTVWVHWRRVHCGATGWVAGKLGCECRLYTRRTWASSGHDGQSFGRDIVQLLGSVSHRRVEGNGIGVPQDAFVCARIDFGGARDVRVGPDWGIEVLRVVRVARLAPEQLD